MIPKKANKSKRPNRRKFLMAIPPLGGALLGLVLAKTSNSATRQLLNIPPSPLKDVPLPKFSIGERVINSYTVDDDLAHDNGLTVENKGFVVGLWWNDRAVDAHQEGSDLDFYFHGWVYVVCFFELPLEPYFAPMRSPVAEEDLQPWGGVS